MGWPTWAVSIRVHGACSGGIAASDVRIVPVERAENGAWRVCRSPFWERTWAGPKVWTVSSRDSAQEKGTPWALSA